MQVANAKRIGIEAEVRTYTLDGTITTNGVLLTQSNRNIIDNQLNYPYLKIVSEGTGTGSLYMEAIFGPVPFTEIATVKKVLRILLAVKGKTLAEWVTDFNAQIKGKVPIHYTLNMPPTTPGGIGNTKLKIMPGTQNLSIQTNIAVPLEAFRGLEFNTFFEGSGLGTIFKQAQDWICKDKICGTNLTPQLESLSIFICYLSLVYDKERKNIGDTTGNIKQNFQVLPKTSPKDMGQYLNATEQNIINNPNYIANVTPAKVGTNVSTNIVNYITNVTQSFGNYNASPHLTPRPTNIIPVMDVTPAQVGKPNHYIVIEIRKSDNPINRAINDFSKSEDSIIKDLELIAPIKKWLK